MRILVVGCGSIGKRHLRNLKTLNAGELLAFDPSNERLSEAQEQSGAKPLKTLAEGLAAKPDIVLIATPNSIHVEPALEAARAGCHLFIEKPISHTAAGINELEAAVKKGKLRALVGCNWRFHPGIATIKKFVASGELGKPWTSRIAAGFYLPDWHPGEDYRQGYSARRELGGGIALDAIHQIDYALWLFGAAKSVTGVAAKVSDLQIDVEDTTDLIIRHDSGAVSNIHLDYLQRAYVHTASVSCSEGSLEWSIAEPVVKIYRAKTKAWETLALPKEDINEMYLAEMRHLLACVKTGRDTMNGIAEARRALEAALKARA